MSEIAEILKAGQPYIKEPLIVGNLILTLIIVYLFRALQAKDKFLERMIDSSQSRAETTARLTALLETLVTRSAGGNRNV